LPVAVVSPTAPPVAAPHGLSPEAVWQWAFVERMSTGLLCAKLGHDDWARPLLAVADAWAEGA
jgi:streptomycin 6-kinase